MIRRPDLSRQRLLRVDEAAARRGPWVALDLSSLKRSLGRQEGPARPLGRLGPGLPSPAAPGRPPAEAKGPSLPEAIANDNAAGRVEPPLHLGAGSEPPPTPLILGCEARLRLAPQDEGVKGGTVAPNQRLRAIPAADWIAVDPGVAPRPSRESDVVDLAALRRASYRRSVLLALILAVLLVQLWRGQGGRETRAIVVPEPESPAARIG